MVDKSTETKALALVEAYGKALDASPDYHSHRRDRAAMNLAYYLENHNLAVVQNGKCYVSNNYGYVLILDICGRA